MPPAPSTTRPPPTGPLTRWHTWLRPASACPPTGSTSASGARPGAAVPPTRSCARPPTRTASSHHHRHEHRGDRAVAALRLLEAIDEGEAAAGVRTVPCRLVVREST